LTKLLNVNELTEVLNVSRAQIYKLINKGLPVIKIGNNTRFDVAEVMKWVKDQNNG
jgi:excisionase family DNA binding protein